MEQLRAYSGFLHRFRKARRGAVAVLFAVMLVPLILGTGMAVDFARLEILTSSLQSIADGAALAGASALCNPNASTSAVTVATDYFTRGAASLATIATVASPTVTIPSTVEVTVTATATLQNTFMSLVMSGSTVAVTASAEGPSYTLQVTKTGGFTSSAYDGDSIYYYIASGAVPTSVSAMTLLFTNDPSVDANYAADNAATKKILVGANDNVGFALVNKTGGVQGYGANGYGAAQGTTHILYSSLSATSSDAYNTSEQGTFYTGITSKENNTTSCSRTAITATNSSYSTRTSSNTCNYYPCAKLSNSVVLENNLLINGSCSKKSTAVQTCLQLSKNSVTFAWNDMGGGSDDFDYNDAAYTVGCSASTSSDNTTEPSAVILVK